MTKVLIQQFDGDVIAESNLDIVPRVGEMFRFDTMDLSWIVRSVQHELRTVNDTVVEQAVTVVVAPISTETHSVYVEWQNKAERPNWIGDDMMMGCDAIPRQGDIVQISVNDERYGTDDQSMASVEVIAVVHLTLLRPYEDEFPAFADQTTIAVIVRNVDQLPGGDMQRVMASRRN